MEHAAGKELPSAVKARACGRSKAFLRRLEDRESPGFTARRARREAEGGASQEPVVWSEALDCNVWDVDARRYVDLTSGFGAAAVGHRHPSVVRAICDQAERLVHALGDVHPSDVKIELLERLASLAPWPRARVALGLHGSDALEIALKTAILATGRAGVLAFEGGYHGLSHGPLALCGFDRRFAEPFAHQLNPHVVFAPYPAKGVSLAEAVRALEAAWQCAREPIGCVVVEPVLGRGGIHVPPRGFLQAVRRLCDQRGALFVADEVLTGLGRCGAWWRSVNEGCMPDLLCAGKALGGGFPVSACLGRDDVMAAWADARYEAIHTATFVGHPIGCAAALATLRVLEKEHLVDRAAAEGAAWMERLRERLHAHPEIAEVRGVGLLIGVEFDSSEHALSMVSGLQSRGFLALIAGSTSNVVELLPPLTIERTLLDPLIDAIEGVLAEGRL